MVTVAPLLMLTVSPLTMESVLSLIEPVPAETVTSTSQTTLSSLSVIRAHAAVPVATAVALVIPAKVNTPLLSDVLEVLAKVGVAKSVCEEIAVSGVEGIEPV